MKFLILLPYYHRPKIVLNALESIIKLKYDNFEVAFIDDSGNTNFHTQLYEYLPENLHTRVRYIPILEDGEQKNIKGGSCHGYYMNQEILRSDADVSIILCDDDALVEDYLNNLNTFYTLCTEINYAYSYVKYYDPEKEHYSKGTAIPRYSHHGSTYSLNMHILPINPYCNVDASQVTFRNKTFKEDGIRFPDRQTRGLDAALFSQLYGRYGNCVPTLFFGEYKGAFPGQLGNRRSEFDIDAKD